jgi:hypothetical protein
LHGAVSSPATPYSSPWDKLGTGTGPLHRTLDGTSTTRKERTMRVVLCFIVVVSVSAVLAVGGAAAKSGSQCKNIRTYQQAAKAGEMPAIVAALHGGVAITNPLLTCSN